MQTNIIMESSDFEMASSLGQRDLWHRRVLHWGLLHPGSSGDHPSVSGEREEKVFSHRNMNYPQRRQRVSWYWRGLGGWGGAGSGGGYKSKRQRMHGRSQSCWSCVFPFCAPQLLESWSERFIFCKICCCAITLIRNEEGRGGRGRRACAMHNVHGRKLFFWREYFFGQCKEQFVMKDTLQKNFHCAESEKEI